MASTKNPLHRLFKVDAAFHGDRSTDKRNLNDNLEVISLGLSRTGTTSLQEALILLGYGPCHGGVDMFRSPTTTAIFTDLYSKVIAGVWKAGDPILSETIRKTMRGYRSATDEPIAFIVPEMVAAYPDSKFILSVRPGGGEAWWASIWNTSKWHWRKDWGRVLFRFCIWPVSFLRKTDDKVQLNRTLYLQRYGCWDARTYDKHNDHVKALVPKKQLLVFDVREGWEPLCKFLGVEVPDVPFPKLNEAESMQALYAAFMTFGAVVWMFYLGLAAAAGYVAMNPWVVQRALDVGMEWARKLSGS